MKDPRIEQVLNSNNRIAYEYIPVVKLSDVDFKRSQQNQARIEDTLDRDLVKQYVQALRNGDQFPAVVLYEDNGKYVSIDGNHRLQSHKDDDRGSIDAYLVVTDDALERQILTYELNTLNGRPTSDEDREAQAINLIQTGTMSVANVAERLHISANRIHLAIADRKASDRASNLSAESLYKKITAKNLRVKISTSLPLDKVFVLALRYQVAYHLGRNDLITFLGQVTSYGSEEEQLGYIKNRIAAAEKLIAKEREEKAARKNPNTKGRTGPMSDPGLRLRAHLTYFINNTDQSSVHGLLKPERDELVRNIAKARASLDALEKELTK